MVVSSSIDFENIQGLLSTKRVISVLRFCDGEYTISEIAKKSGLQLSNASQYINKLRERRPCMFSKSMDDETTISLSSDFSLFFI